jgi:hypothetical protein
MEDIEEENIKIDIQFANKSDDFGIVYNYRSKSVEYLINKNQKPN